MEVVPGGQGRSKADVLFVGEDVEVPREAGGRRSNPTTDRNRISIKNSLISMSRLSREQIAPPGPRTALSRSSVLNAEAVGQNVAGWIYHRKSPLCRGYPQTSRDYPTTEPVSRPRPPLRSRPGPRPRVRTPPPTGSRGGCPRTSVPSPPRSLPSGRCRWCRSES